MLLIEKGKPDRPVCAGIATRRCSAIGPAGRKRWRCLDCQIEIARTRQDWPRFNALTMLQYVRTEKARVRRAG
jgi:hypothetical protein